MALRSRFQQEAPLMSESDRTAVRTRIAPSPTGEAHIGNLYVALVNWAIARQAGGRFIVRIEDTDRARFVEGAEQIFLDALEWLGLDHDEGPDVGGPAGPYRQSERLDLYRRHVGRLLADGHGYRCFCTPERLAEVRKSRQKAGQATGYDRKCRSLPPDVSDRRAADGEPHTVRLAVPMEGQTRFADGLRGDIVIDNREIDDQVLLKSDGYPTYHLAVVVDDRLMGITDVVRAEEWIVSTPKHVLLYAAFGWEPPRFHHLPLLRNPDKSKLSKRKNPVSVAWYRAEGFLPEAVVNYLGLLGHSMPEGQEIFSKDEFLAAFSTERLVTSGPVFDLDKFEWLNGQWIRRLAPEDLLDRLRREGFLPEALAAKYDEEGLKAIVNLMQERMRRLSEFEACIGFFIEREPYEADLLIPTKGKKRKPTRTGPETLAALEEMKKTIANPLLGAEVGTPSSPTSPGTGRYDAEALEQALRDLAETMGWKPGELFAPLRVAVTCRRVSTPLFETMEILGRRECLDRLDEAIDRARSLA
jgi:glutamyl-tRNA synthetase